MPDIPEKLVAYDVPVMMSITKDEGLVIAVFVFVQEVMDELNKNWNELLPHLLDYDYTISNESLRTKIAQDIRKFYFGNKLISMETKSNLIEVNMNELYYE